MSEINCRHCGGQMKLYTNKAEPEKGIRGGQSCRCANLDCPTHTHSFYCDEYDTEDLEVWIELDAAYAERYRLGRVTERLETARAAMESYLLIRRQKRCAQHPEIAAYFGG